MATRYRRVTLSLVVKEQATAQVREELIEAVELIHADNVVFEHSIKDERSPKPASADDYQAHGG